ncbi:MAG: enoyl-CoA hydratase/isomerase family protein [Anaerolineae bacterium]|nr:enoyl-CoA hydratase/isomerase family protein [Anaerolineae bacterium]
MPQTLAVLEIIDRVAVVRINNPPANALTLATVAALHSAMTDALAGEAKAVILTGQGHSFCAGADIRELHALGGRQEAEALSRQGQALCETMETASKPIIAAINGRYALGGGCELLMACHLRLAEESTQLGSPEVQLGLMVGWGGSQRMPRLVGLGRALDLLLTGRRISAAEAAAIGLVNRVVPDGTVLEEALKLAQQLAALSAPVLAATLKATLTGVREGYEVGLTVEREEFAHLCDHDDWREGTQAFLEKRPPRFTDG